MVLCSRLGAVKLQVYWQETQHDYRLLYLVIAMSAATWQSVLLPPAGRRTPEGGASRLPPEGGRKEASQWQRSIADEGF